MIDKGIVILDWQACCAHAVGLTNREYSYSDCRRANATDRSSIHIVYDGLLLLRRPLSSDGTLAYDEIIFHQTQQPSAFALVMTILYNDYKIEIKTSQATKAKLNRYRKSAPHCLVQNYAHGSFAQYDRRQRPIKSTP